MNQGNLMETILCVVISFRLGHFPEVPGNIITPLFIAYHTVSLILQHLSARLTVLNLCFLFLLATHQTQLE